MLILVWFGVFLARVSGRSVSIDVDAAWPRFLMSSVAEMGEFVAKLSSTRPEAYWTFVNEMCTQSSRVEELLYGMDTDASLAELRGLGVEAAVKSTSRGLEELMDTSLDVGMFAPTLEFYRAQEALHGDPCAGKAFVAVYAVGAADEAEIVCEDSSLQPTAAASAASAARLTADVAFNSETAAVPVPDESSHVYAAGGVGGTTPVLLEVVVYGVPGDPAYCALHKAATATVEVLGAAGVRYESRPGFAGVAPVTNSTALRGFGVLLDIKNMEYRAVDDRNSASGDNSEKNNENATANEIEEEVSFPVGEAVSGVVFDTLLKRAEVNPTDLRVLREVLLAGASAGSDDLKVWEMKNLGLQTTQLIVDAPDPVSKMMSLVQSFPAHALSVSSTKLRPSLVEDIDRFATLGGHNGIPTNALFINGRVHDLSGATLNVFDVITSVGTEHQLLEVLAALPVNREQRRKALSTAMTLGSGSNSFNQRRSGGGAGGTAVRVDVSKGGKHTITFLNNLEKDRAYKRWPSSLKTLLYPSYSLATVARNLYTVVAVVDPLSVGGVDILVQLHGMYQQQYPLRIGVVLDCSGKAGKGNSDWPALGTEVCYLFSHLKAVSSPSKAVSFLLELASVLKLSIDGGTVSLARKEVEALYSKAVSEGTKREAHSASDLTAAARKHGSEGGHVDDAGADDPFDMCRLFVDSSRSYLEARDLPVNSFSLNGRVVHSTEVGEELMQVIGAEQFLLSTLLRTGKIHDGTKSIFSALMDLGREEAAAGSGGNEEPDMMESMFGSARVGAVHSHYHPLLSSSDPPMHISGSSQSSILMDAVAHRFVSVARAGPDSDVDDDDIGCPRTSVLLSTPLSRNGFQSAAAGFGWLRKDSGQGRLMHRVGATFFSENASGKAYPILSLTLTLTLTLTTSIP